MGTDTFAQSLGMGDEHSLTQRVAAEFLGTFVLVFGGCGAAVLAAGVPDVGIGFLGVALAFGLTVLTMAYAVGHVSGGHFNPAVTLGLALAGRFRWKDAVPYAVTQVAAAIAAAAVLFIVANGKSGFSAKESGFATNGYGDRSPEGYSLLAVLVIEVVLTAVFLYVILGATDTRAPKGFAPIAIGLVADPDPPGQHPGQQHLGEPCPVDRPGPVRRQRRPRAAVGVLGGTAGRRRHRRGDVRAAVRQGQGRRASSGGDRGLRCWVGVLAGGACRIPKGSRFPDRPETARGPPNLI